jgi:hypothetical protein
MRANERRVDVVQHFRPDLPDIFDCTLAK